MVPVTAMRSLQETVAPGGLLTGLVPAEMSVPGFVVVASDDRDDRVPPHDVERFAAAYEALCGAAPRRTYTAESFAHLIEFSRDDALASPDADRGSWSVVAGVAHGPQGAWSPDAALLEGQFALVTYDEGSRTLTVATDPFGLFPLYHARRDGLHYFSTSALAIAKHLAAPPEVLGLFLFLRTGYHFGARTHWQGVERLEPGHRMHFTRDGSRLERYWLPEPDEAVTRLDLEAAARLCVHACVDTFRAVYADDEPVWADLTGGYDTRLLTLALQRAGVRFTTNTVGPEWLEDVRIARLVAEAAGFEWTRIPLDAEADDDFPARFARALAAGQGQLDVVQLMGVLAAHHAKRARLRRLLTGGGGEQFQFYAWKTEFAHAGRSTHVNMDNWVRMRMLLSLDTSIFADYPAREVEADIRDRCVAWVAPYRDEINTRQLEVLFAYKATGHFGAYTGAASSVLRAELPFYLRPVFGAAFSSSYRHRNGHRLMQHMIEELQPRVAAIRTTKGGPAQPMRLANLHRFVPYYAHLGSKAVEKVAGLRLYTPPSERRPPISPARRVAARALLGDDVRSFRSRALYKTGELERLFADAEQPAFAQATLFGRIVTVEAALRAVDAEVMSRDRP
jgi:glutamine amidotransferase-like protein